MSQDSQNIYVCDGCSGTRSRVVLGAVCRFTLVCELGGSYLHYGLWTGLRAGKQGGSLPADGPRRSATELKFMIVSGQRLCHVS